MLLALFLLIPFPKGDNKNSWCSFYSPVLVSTASVQLLSGNPASRVVRAWFWCLLALFLEAANCTLALAVGLITRPCTTTGCVVAKNTRLSLDTKVSLIGTTIYEAMARCKCLSSGNERDWLPQLPLTSSWYFFPWAPCSVLWCCGAEATEGIIYSLSKFGMPEKEVDSHRTLADASRDLSPVRKSAWDVGLIVGSLFVPCMKIIVVVWYDPDLVYAISFLQPPFSQLDHIHIGCAHTSLSGSITEFLCTDANPGYIQTSY